jgi:alpha-ketoglutarate-dependent taurine dioxygenase
MPLEIEETAQPLGAEVKGLDPTVTLNEEDLRRLKEAFDRRGVLVFRDLDIDQGFQAQLSEQLIGVESGRGGSGESEVPESYISNRKAGAAAPYGRLQFHSDTMWAKEPLQVLSLYGLDVGAPVPPTTFASTIFAWKALSDDLRSRVSDLRAVHTAGQHKQFEDDDLIAAVPETPKSTTTPIGLRHPRTDETMLYVCEQMTHEILNVSPEESEELLESLFGYLYNPENLFHHDWRNHDLVIWDNLAVQHARPNVAQDGPARTLRKFVSPLEGIAVEERAFNYSTVPAGGS